MSPFAQKINKNTKHASSQKLRFTPLVLMLLLFFMTGRSSVLQHSVAEAAAPQVTIISPENKTYLTPYVHLVFAVDEEVSWMGYSLDFQENVTITGNVTLPELTEGVHNVIVFANDTLGFMGASERVYFTVVPVHDVAVVNVSLPYDNLFSGEVVNVNVTVRNKGSVPESFNVTVYYNDTIVETERVGNLTEGSDAALTIRWNTTGLPLGIYIIKAEASVVEGEVNNEDNVFVYGAVMLYAKPVVEIRPQEIQAKAEQDFEIEVWIVNATNLNHFEFNMSHNPSLLYVTGVMVYEDQGMFLKGPYSSYNMHHDAAKGSFYISLTQSSVAMPVNGTGPLARITVKIIGTVVYSWEPSATNFLHCNLTLADSKIGARFEDFRLLEQQASQIAVHGAEYWFRPVPGDLNLDGIADVIDLAAVGKMFGTVGESIFDVNGDGIVDAADLALVAMNIGRSKP